MRNEDRTKRMGGPYEFCVTEPLGPRFRIGSPVDPWAALRTLQTPARRHSEMPNYIGST